MGVSGCQNLILPISSGLFNDAATQTFITVVKDDGLARSYRPLWLPEGHPATSSRQGFDPAGLIRLAIADFGLAFPWCRQGQITTPVDNSRLQPVAEQPGVIVALAYDQNVLFKVFAQHIPGGLIGSPDTAYAKSPPLPQGVVHQTVMPPNPLTLGGSDVAGLGG